MAEATTVGNGFAMITDPTADWNGATHGLENIPLRSITFVSSAADDRLIVHDGGIDEVYIYDSGPVTDTQAVTQYFPGREVTPVIDDSDCTYGTSANCVIIFRW